MGGSGDSGGPLHLPEVGGECVMLTHPAVKSSTPTGFACPEVHEGVLLDGSLFEFRYRHGEASLAIGRRLPLWPYRSRRTVTMAVETHGGADGIFASDAQRNAVFAVLFTKHVTGEN